MYYPPLNKSLGAEKLIDYYVSDQPIVDVADEPLTLDDEVIHSRIDLGSPADSDEQTYVESLFPAARKAIEEVIHRPIGVQEFELGMTRFPCGWIIELPKPPLVAIKSIKYTKQDGTVVTLHDITASPVVTSTIFTVETGSTPGAIFLKATEAWPSDILSNGFPVKIRFTAGIDPVPANLMQAMRYAFGHFYDNREAVTDGRVNQPFEVPKTLDWLCDPFKFEAFG